MASLTEVPAYVEIPPSQIELLRQIGHGSQGRIYLARYHGGLTCAKVFYHLNDMNKEVSMLEAAKESCCAPSLYGTCTSLKLVLMEVVPGVTLQIYLMSRPCRVKVHKVMIAVGQAIERLHRFRLVHNDLKFDNIMVSTSNNEVNVRLIDFGWSSLTASSSYHHISSENMKLFPHVCPRLANGGASDNASDNYSYGILLGTIANNFKCRLLNYLAQILTNGSGTVNSLQHLIHYAKDVKCQHCQCSCFCGECLIKRQFEEDEKRNNMFTKMQNPINFK